MPIFDIPKLYQDGTDFTAGQLDAIAEYIEASLNTTKIDYQNIQSGGVTADNLAAGAVTNTKLDLNAVTTAKMADSVVTTPKIVDNAVTLAKLATALQNLLVPVGLEAFYGSVTPPTGWLLCDGSIVTTAAYPQLFGVLGTSSGTGYGDGASFHLPDYRGRFPRGLVGSSGRDPDSAGRTADHTGGNTGANIGSVQGDAAVGITIPTVDLSSDTGATGLLAHTHAIGTQFFGGSTETRPKNIYRSVIIKAS
jgi:microcystin-dependent protein